MTAEIEYWIDTSAGYDNRYTVVTVEGGNQADCIEAAQEKVSNRAKDFKFYRKLDE